MTYYIIIYQFVLSKGYSKMKIRVKALDIFKDVHVFQWVKCAAGNHILPW